VARVQQERLAEERQRVQVKDMARQLAKALRHAQRKATTDH